MIADLRKLWQEAFDDPDDFTNLFFAKGFSPDRYHCIQENGIPVSALYWFDCYLEGRKFAYLYGVATSKSHQGKGFAKRLLQETHNILKAQGYAGVILVPAVESLFDFYQKLGYETATTISRLICQAGDTSVDIRKISPDEYTRLRKDFLPEGSVESGAEALAFLAGFCDFYVGENFLLIGGISPDGFWAQELLGNYQAAPGVLRALGCQTGHFRCPGTDHNFAMWLPLQADCPKPAWFSLALD